MRFRSIALTGLAITLFGAAVAFVVAAQRSPFRTTVIDKPNGYFYRTTAKFSIKVTGEPVEFDFVVACHLEFTRSSGTGSSDDSQFTPVWMLKVTRDGHGVMLRAARLCGTAGLKDPVNTYVPSDYLPRILWFEKADDMRFGYGYFSIDAYENPNTKLNFHGASVTPATADDWLAWRKQAARDYVPRPNWPGPWGMDNTSRIALNHLIGQTCRFWQRLKLPNKAREMLRELWPTDQPRFWGFRRNEAEAKIYDDLTNRVRSVPVTVGVSYPRVLGSAYRFNLYSEGMLPLRSGRVRGKNAERGIGYEMHGEFYPEVRLPIFSEPPPAVRAFRIEFRGGEFKGLAGCQTLESVEDLDRRVESGQRYRDLTERYLDDRLLGAWPWSGVAGFGTFFESDEYFWEPIGGGT